MLPAFFMALYGIVVAILAVTINAGSEVQDRLEEELSALTVQEISTAVDAYYSLNNYTLPASSAAFVAAPGFEYLRTTFQNQRYVYRLSTPKDDGQFRYVRAGYGAIADNELFTVLTGGSSTFFTLNSCGAGDFDAPGQWCGPATALWSRKSTRDEYAARLGKVRAGLDRTLLKFSAIYSAGITDPANPSVRFHRFPSGGLAPNGSRPLHEMMGASTTLTPANCASTSTGAPGAPPGLFMLNGMVFECSDLFNGDNNGSPGDTSTVRYTYINPQYIVLATPTTVLDSSGNRILVAQEVIAE